MLILTRVGCAIILYIPYCLIGSAIIQKKPQLFHIWLLSVIWAYCTVYWITSLLYMSIRPNEGSEARQVDSTIPRGAMNTWDPWCSTFSSLSTHSQPFYQRWHLVMVTVFVFHQLVQFVSKTVLFLLLLRFNTYLRGERQVLLISSYRFAPVGATVGLGYAAVSLVLSGGYFLDADIQLSGIDMKRHFFSALFSSHSSWSVSRSVVGYDLHICPQLPLVVYRSLQSFLYSIASMFWCIIHSIATAALYSAYIERKVREPHQKKDLRKCESKQLEITEGLFEPRSPVKAETLLPNTRRMKGNSSQGILLSRSCGVLASCSLDACLKKSKDDCLDDHILSKVLEADPMEASSCKVEGLTITVKESVPLKEKGELQCMGSELPIEHKNAFEEDKRGACASCELLKLEEKLNSSPSQNGNGALLCSELLMQHCGQQSHVIFPEDSLFSKLKPVYAYLALLFAFLYAFFFSLVTLQSHNESRNDLGLSNSATLCSSFRIISDQGCVVSLYLQLMLASASLLFTIVLTRIEYRAFFYREVREY